MHMRQSHDESYATRQRLSSSSSTRIRDGARRPRLMNLSITFTNQEARNLSGHLAADGATRRGCCRRTRSAPPTRPTLS